MVSRFVDWFWLRDEERAVRAGGAAAPRVMELSARAALAAEAAVRTERPAEPFAHDGNDALAAELYRQAVHWALCAHDALSAEDGAQAAEPGATPADDLPALLERANRALLTRAAGSDDALAQLEKDLGAGSYREFAELEPDAQRVLVERVGRFAQALLEPLRGIEGRLERIRVRRLVHVLGALALLAAAALGVRRYLRDTPPKHALAGENHVFTARKNDEGSTPCSA